MPCWPADTPDPARALLFADIDDWIDEEGRPVGEIRASAATRRAIGARYARCPYGGSRGRQARLINVSALDQTLTHWPAARAILLWARAAAGIAPGTGVPSIALARAAAFVQILPCYAAFADPALDRLPAAYAAAHKMAAGLFGLLKNRLIDVALSGGDPFATCETARDLHGFAERSGALLSRTAIEACAGPAAHIAEALRVLTGEVRGTPRPGEVAPDLPDADGFARYADAVIGLHLWLGAFSARCRLADAVDPDALAEALPAVRAIAAMPRAALPSYGLGCLVLLKTLHPRLAPVAAWHRDGLVAADASPVAVFAALRGRALSAFRGPLPPIDDDQAMMGRWCAVRRAVAI